MDGNANKSADPTMITKPEQQRTVVEWNWEIEHADRKREREMDAALHLNAPFEVDRRVLKDVVKEKMSTDVGRIKYLSAGACRHFRL